ncbi:SDR family NAD(P)-dependent oxidoreductase [Rubellicoccus peritrichatus]|uniref:SDR family NAD(P)-dependent oxidoreductase n=1 Tax=Rubellicoccus peritrichatus TaxID=3080537 RepID=A0AAQ3LFB0_9BACT|nr:SDR family NAD(P)-dependent oxidoreductase [Puniceicoccus sp. CR14]WOO42835.1 SDR family NAD(P)-dependent oxidoreductase [Puniceicoccus sp. CR14]
MFRNYSMTSGSAAYVHKITAVVVTGGSSGIGKTFIEQIFKLGSEIQFCNLSRKKPEFPALTGLKLEHFPCDLTDKSQIEVVFPELDAFLAQHGGDGEILLINNSGFGCYGSAQDLEIGRELEMLSLNINALVHLTGLMLPRMLKQGGVVLDVASTAAFQPTPQLSAYGATKAFVLHWNLALGDDLKGTKVRTLCLCPGPTATNFFKAAGFDESPLPNFGQTAEQVVDETLRALNKGKRLVVTGFSNKLIAFFSSRFLSKPMVTGISGWILRKVRQQ